MTFPQRLLVFIIGILLGSVLVSYIMRERREAAAQHRTEEAELAPVGTEAIQRAAVPGIINAYNRHRKPMHDAKHVASAIVTAEDAPAGLRSRFILLRGKGDADQVLGIREWIGEDADLVWGDVLDVRIFAADRVLVRVKPNTTREQLVTALEPLGMAIVRGIAADADPADPTAPLRISVDNDAHTKTAIKGDQALTATIRPSAGSGKRIRLETPPDVAQTDLYLVGFTAEAADSALQARAALRALPQVESAEFDFLDTGHRYTQSPQAK